MKLLEAVKHGWVLKTLQRRSYKTHNAVFGFCPQTKKAIDSSEDALQKLSEYGLCHMHHFLSFWAGCMI